MLPEFSRARLVELIDSGKVLANGKAQKRSFRCEPGWIVTLEALPADRPPHDLTPADIPLEIAYEDDSLLVVNKPRGLAVHPAPSLKAPSLVNALLARNPNLSQAAGAFRPGIVHRLDKETTGLVAVAKTDSAHLSLARQFANKTASRIYLAVVKGVLDQERFKVDAPIARDPANRKRMAIAKNGKPAVTHMKKLKRLEDGTLIACKLETGRTHQIRVHCAAIGHPILGDPTYGRKETTVLPMQLHAAELAFDHPVSGGRLRFFASPPDDFLEDLSAEQFEVLLGGFREGTTSTK